MGVSRSFSWARRLGVMVCLAASDTVFAADRTVTMNDSLSHQFTPATLSIIAGDRVIWKNQAIITPHNVTCNSAPPAAGCWPASGTISPGGSFTRTFTITGSYPYRCTLHEGMNGTVTVSLGTLHHFTVSAPATATAGVPFAVSVTARDVNNNLLSFSGSVQLSISNPHPDGGELPPTVTLSAGSGSFNVTPKRSGSRTITATSGSVTGSDIVTVNPAGTSQLVITAPANATATGAFQVVVSARDPFNNLVTGYTGTVHFTSSDLSATLPANSTLTAGTRNFNVTLATSGPQVITVTDTVAPAITGSTTVTVAIDCSVSFNNPAAINTPVIGLATLYPSNISVGGLKQTINGMSVTLNGVTHTQPADFDVLLVGPRGQKMIIMADSGSTPDVSNISITFSDAGTALLPLTTILTSGTFKPTNHGGADNFASPAPAAPYSNPGPDGTATFASVFNGTDPNGTWSLYVVDDLGSAGTSGGFAGGWTLTFAAPPNTYCNKTTIAIPTIGNAAPYPSNIIVSGVDGTIKSATVRLNQLSHFSTGDLDLLLVGPGDRKMTILSDVSTTSAINTVISLDDSGVAIPATLISGVFQPRNVSVDADLFSSPAPAPPYSDPAPTGSATLASVFNGADPNGTWQLFVVDDVFGTIGTPGNIQQGWALTLDVVFNTTITLTSGTNPGFAGDLINFQANVTSTGPIPTGAVTFKNGPAVLGTEQLIEGSAAIDFAFVPGVHNITATYNGASNFHPSASDPVMQTVIPASTTVTVVSSLNPSTFGQPVALTATVAKLGFSIFSPTGTVTFLDEGTVLGTGLLNASGVATVTTTAVGGGSRSITAVYEGDGNFAPSTSAELTQTVNAAATTTTLVASPNPSSLGDSVTFTATVSGGGIAIPAGTVTFNEGTTTLGTSTLNESGVATFNASSLSIGDHGITAVYDGSNNFAVSTSAVLTQTVEKATPAISVLSFQNPTGFGDEATFRADVTSPASAVPTGIIFFKDGQTLLGTVPLDASGTAQLSTSTLTAGNHNITAGYDGDSNFKGNISPVLVQEVIGLESITTLTANLNPAVFGPFVIFTATVTSASGGPATGGTVTFLKDGVVLLANAPLNSSGVVQGGGQLPAGQYTITAIYNGGPIFAGSTSNTITQTVNPSTARFLGPVSPSKFFFRFREPIGFQVQVISNTGGLPTGTVTLYEGDTALETTTLDSAGRAIIMVPGLSVGEHQLRVVYSGDSNFPVGAESDPIIYNRSPRPR